MLRRTPNATINHRLDVTARDPVLSAAAPGTSLQHAEPHPCDDSAAPHYEWEYGGATSFATVADHLDALLTANGWSRQPNYQRVDDPERGDKRMGWYQKRVDGWTVAASVFESDAGYRVVAQVDSDLYSGCAR